MTLVVAPESVAVVIQVGQSILVPVPSTEPTPPLTTIGPGPVRSPPVAAAKREVRGRLLTIPLTVEVRLPPPTLSPLLLIIMALATTPLTVEA